MKILLTILLIMPLTVSAADTIPRNYLGKWKAYSRAIEAIYGNLEIRQTSLSFKLLGNHTFQVVGTLDGSVVVEMSKTYKDDCGRYIRLGPIDQNGKLNFTVFDSKDKALMPRKINRDTNGLECTWGLYSPVKARSIK